MCLCQILKPLQQAQTEPALPQRHRSLTYCTISGTPEKKIYIHIHINTHTHTFFFFFYFSGQHLWHMEVPRLGSNQSYTTATATATQNPSHICNLHCSSRQCQILNPLSEARDRTHVLMDISQVHYCGAIMGTPENIFLKYSNLKSKLLLYSWAVEWMWYEQA